GGVTGGLLRRVTSGGGSDDLRERNGEIEEREDREVKDIGFSGGG
ncbi:hypothetical protein Tco_0042984, partial [Tanacetum coccineum]